MIKGMLLGFVLGAPLWFGFGVILMGGLCAASEREETDCYDLEGDEDSELGRLAQR